MSETQTPKKSKREPLVPSRIQLADQASNRWRATLEAGTTLDEIKDPGYWAHFASKLHQYDDIVCIEESGAFRADLMVTACARTWATVKVLALHKLEESEAAAPTQASQDYRIEWAGPHHKFRMVRGTDNEVIRDGLQTKAEAQAYLADFLVKAAA